MSTYQELDTKLHDKRHKPPMPISKKKVSGNTWLTRSGEDINVLYHQTNILTFRPNGTVTLVTNGWETVTTKQRMNSFLGKNLGVSSRNGEWWVEARQTETMTDETHWREELVWTHRCLYPYVDGMSFDVETGLLAWNPHTWEPMEFVSGMVSAPIINRLNALESAMEEALEGRRELSNDFLNECLQRRETLQEQYKALHQSCLLYTSPSPRDRS